MMKEKITPVDRQARKQFATAKTTNANDVPQTPTRTNRRGTMEMESSPPSNSNDTKSSNKTTANTKLSAKLAILSVIMAAITYGCVSQIVSTLKFWFLRTLIRCPISNETNYTYTTSAISNDNGTLRSGSPICLDREQVADKAQVLLTVSSTISTLMALICVPLLGALSDRCGRRPIFIIGSVQTLVVVICYAFAAQASVDGNDRWAFGMVVIGSGLNGALGIFGATVTTMIVDTFVSNAINSNNANGLTKEEQGRKTEDKMGKMIGLFQCVKFFGTAIGMAVGGYYLNLNLDYYAGTWFVLIFPCALCTIFALFSPETLQPKIRRRSQSIRGDAENILVLKQALSSMEEDNGEEEYTTGAHNTSRCQRVCRSLTSPCRLCVSSRTIAIIACFVFLFTLGGSSLVVVQSYMTTVLHHTQTEVFFIGASGFVVALLSLGCGSLFLLKKIGALLGLIVAAVLATVGLACMSMALILPSLFYIGILIMATSLFGGVAYLQFISARFDPSQMGALQGALSACALGGFMIGSWLFTALSYYNFNVFGIGSVVMAIGTMLIFYLKFHRDKGNASGGSGGSGGSSDGHEQGEYLPADVDSDGK